MGYFKEKDPIVISVAVSKALMRGMGPKKVDVEQPFPGKKLII